VASSLWLEVLADGHHRRTAPTLHPGASAALDWAGNSVARVKKPFVMVGYGLLPVNSIGGFRSITTAQSDEKLNRLKSKTEAEMKSARSSQVFAVKLKMAETSRMNILTKAPMKQAVRMCL
jgi:hypothetical protein